ncbi:MAG: divalent-cation tolerance protein CutA [Desulfovibrionaceae bacterium]
MSEYCLVYMTAPDMAEAERIAEALLERRLAACVNVLPGMSSFYRWQGRVEKSEEVVVLAKTRTVLVSELSETVAGMHAYDCPCVVALPIMGGHSPFLSWISEETC